MIDDMINDEKQVRVLQVIYGVIVLVFLIGIVYFKLYYIRNLYENLFVNICF